jgi:Rieske Fe-S protein
MTIERPMFPPIDSTRRRLLTVAAGGAVAAMAAGAVLPISIITADDAQARIAAAS